MLNRKRLAGNAFPQRAALQILHRDERMALVLIDVVDRADVRVVERRCRAGFLSKAVQGVRILGQFPAQKLQGNEPAELRILGLIHDSHSAAADSLDDSIMGYRFADYALILSVTKCQI